MRSTYRFIFTAVVIATTLFTGQYKADAQGIFFLKDIELDNAIKLAKQQKKRIFVDCYTPWCGPCKLMDIQFQDQELASYFNTHYLNIKVNVETKYGRAIKKMYPVVFLPTMFILDEHGNILYVTESGISSDELLSIGKFHNNEKPTELIASEVPETKQTAPVSSETTTAPTMRSADNYSLNDGEKILYTQNDASTDPEFLYQLTYLKLQLQDGTQWEAADQYLATQKDWNTKKNMKFIYDFVRKPNTKMFDHLIQNRVDYEILFGAENVKRSISIMVNMELYQGFPRPTPEEALILHEYIDPNMAQLYTYMYLLERYEQDKNYKNYVTLAYNYLSKYNARDVSIAMKLVKYHEQDQANITIDELISQINASNQLTGMKSYELYYCLAQLYLRKPNKRQAARALSRAESLAKQRQEESIELIQLKQLIEQM